MAQEKSGSEASAWSVETDSYCLRRGSVVGSIYYFFKAGFVTIRFDQLRGWDFSYAGGAVETELNISQVRKLFAQLGTPTYRVAWLQEAAWKALLERQAK